MEHAQIVAVASTAVASRLSRPSEAGGRVRLAVVIVVIGRPALGESHRRRRYRWHRRRVCEPGGAAMGPNTR